jgi:hypothetical protein
MKTVLANWNLLRIFRLVLGIGIAVQGIISKDTVSLVLGLVLAVMAFANAGCCGVNACAVNPVNKTKSTDEELDIEK